MITGIVLAGGRSTRFGADKLAATLRARPDGTPVTVLAATIQALSGLVDEVLVAGPALPAGFGAEDLPIAMLPDTEPFGGPLLALASVLERVEPHFHHVAIVVGGDMPRLVPSVLARMLDVLDVDESVDAVYLGHPDANGPPGRADTPGLAGTPTTIAADRSAPPRRQVLPLAIRVQPASRAAREAVEAGRRSLQSLVEAMPAIELPATAWMLLDPSAVTLTDIDTRADLDRQNVT